MTERGHFSDLYRAFEDRFRGSEALIRERMTAYLPLVQTVESNPTGERRALDIGCGRGEWLSLLKTDGWAATGVDSNASMAAVARGSGLDVVVADALEYLRAASAASYNLVTAFHVVEHVTNDTLIELLAEIARVLTPNGLVILETPNPENLTVASWSFHMDPTHQKPLPPALLQFLVESAGFGTTVILRLNGSEKQAGGTPQSPLLGLLSNGPDYAVIASNGADASSAAEDLRSFVERTAEPGPVDLAALSDFAAKVERMPSVVDELRSEIGGLRNELSRISDRREQAWAEAAAAKDRLAEDLLRREQVLTALIENQGHALSATVAQIAALADATSAHNAHAQTATHEAAAAKDRLHEDALRREQALTALIESQGRAVSAAMAQIAVLADATLAHNAHAQTARHEAAAAKDRLHEDALRREQALTALIESQGRAVSAAMAQISESQALHHTMFHRIENLNERFLARMEGGESPSEMRSAAPDRPSHALLPDLDHLWAMRGAKAWLTLKPGSRPRRILRRGVFHGRDIIQEHPWLRQLAHRTLRLSPRTQRHIFAILAPPPVPEERGPLPDQIELTLRRLEQAVQICQTPDRPPTQHGDKPRLAYVSPVPPDQSGIADYSAQLLPALAAFYAIDIVSPSDAAQRPLDGIEAGRVSVEWFEANYSSYDRVVYQFGNSPYHSHMPGLLEKFPGIVVLHDLYLSDLFYHIAAFEDQPGAFERAMYASHGFGPASLFNRDPTTLADIVAAYPASFQVLAQAQGVIVHNEHARRLTREFFPALDTSDWQVVPLVRSATTAETRHEARAKLGFGETVFLVCSFGHIQASKKSDILLDAWLASSLATDPTCHLIFVGSVADDEFGRDFLQKLEVAGGNIRATGYVDQSQYHSYLTAADASVQLRGMSRGETSAAALDCLKFGLPMIANANGSIEDLPEDVVFKLPDEVTASDLAGALEAMRDDRERAAAFGWAGQRYIHEQHSAETAARRYQEAIEAFHEHSAPANNAGALVQSVERNLALPSSKRASLRNLARELGSGAAPVPQRRLFVDVSATARDDLRTGIQRVVRALLLELLRAPPAGFRVEPVWLQDGSGAWVYDYARTYTATLLGLENARLTDAPVVPRPGDILLVADYFCGGVIDAHRQGLYKEWRDIGVEIDFVVYDMLPVLRPDWFPPWAAPAHETWSKCIAEAGDRLICISNAVADETRRWLASHGCAPVEVVGWALGADMDASSPSRGFPEDAAEVLAAITSAPSFLMVGTVEPRKGHLQALEAFEVLWAKGSDAKLVIVGSEGWKGIPADKCRNLPHILSRLNDHPELGRRLLWLKSVSDEYLNRIYAASRCLLAASEGEGFGLPLIEAARHGIPILARNIPVFREVAGPHAVYFAASRPDQMAQAIQDWIADYDAGARVLPDHMRWLTWAQSAAQLKAIVFSGSALQGEASIAAI